MKNLHPLMAARRRARREMLLKVENPCCVKCGEAAIECLEVHEIAGFRRDRDTRVILCLNCHRKQTTLLTDAGIEMVREENPQQRSAKWLESNAVFMRDLAKGWDRQAKLFRQLGEQDV